MPGPTTITTPNMNLILPIPGQDPGPDWAQNQYASGFIIDEHNHTSGQGVQIPTAGININTDLTFNSNNAINLNSVRFINLGSPLAGSSPNLGCIYEASGEFWYNDASGNQVQITKSGSVNATSSGIVSGTASASFVGGVLVVDENTNTPANIQAGSYFFGNNISGSNFAEVSAPSSLAASYSMVLPPSNNTGETVLLTFDTSNNIGLGPSVQSVAPTGSIIMFGGTIAPSGWLICDGSSYPQATYSNLYAVIGSAYGTSGSNFNVPDFRGIFPRGVDNGAGNDPDTTSRTAQNTGGNTGDNVGSLQTDAFTTHNHALSLGWDGNGGPYINYFTGDDTSSAAPGTSTAGTSSETRPINLYVNFIIKT